MRTHAMIHSLPRRPATIRTILVYCLATLFSCGYAPPSAKVEVLDCHKVQASPALARIAYRVTVDQPLALARYCAVFKVVSDKRSYWTTEYVAQYLPAGARITGSCDITLGAEDEEIQSSAVDSWWFE